MEPRFRQTNPRTSKFELPIWELFSWPLLLFILRTYRWSPQRTNSELRMRISKLDSPLVVLLCAAIALSNPNPAPAVATSLTTFIDPSTFLTPSTAVTVRSTTNVTTQVFPITSSKTLAVTGTLSSTLVLTSTLRTPTPTPATTTISTTIKVSSSTNVSASPAPSSSAVSVTSIAPSSITVSSISTPKPSATVSIDTGILNGTRTTDILATITGLPPFPTGFVEGTKLNLTDIQGDILVGMKKKKEVFYFFTINNPSSFRKKLHNDLVQKITNTAQLLSVSTQPIVALNLAFTYTGLVALGYSNMLADTPFYKGQWADANNLRDTDPDKNWVPQFKGTKIHGVFLIASDQQNYLDAQIYAISTLFGTDITKVYSLQGNIRPPPFEGHEMFGFLDGVGQPAVSGFNIPLPGQQVVLPGLILTGETGDTLAASRPAWAKNGSFLVFRQLKQLVAAWDNFIFQNAPAVPGYSQAQSADLLGARMIGRWKSGAPVDLSPTADNVALANNINQNNNFDFTHSGYDIKSNQYHCPFAAHIRKTRPRADLNGIPTSNPYGWGGGTGVIMRAGIPYGPEPVNCGGSYCNGASTDDGADRGLAFVSYQSQIANGFQFIQNVWANDPNFAPGKNIQPGLDPSIGQASGAARFMSGYDITNPNKVLNMFEDFVISRGGDYFFAPSISALTNVLSV